MRLKLGAALVLVVLAGATGGAARGGTALIVTGHGWGHGVGMSQWGAYGYALHGWTYKRILSHYYPGTKIGTFGEPQVRVLLTQGANVVTIGCATPMRVTDGRRLTRQLKPGNYGIGPKLALPVKKNGTGLSFGHLAVFDCARAPLTFDGRPYHGTLVVRSQGGHVSVVNSLSLDTYLRGVVPSESPSHWPLAALEAQAVAARSYAVSELRPAAFYDLVPTTADQVYGGVMAERPRSDEAVFKTLGQIVTWNGQVARTYYSSSSGGRTESVQDAWPGAAPVPYLVSVSDPYDTYSPHHDWGPFELSAGTLAGRLGLGSEIESAQIRRDDGYRAESVTFRLASGALATRSGARVERALGLRTNWFSIGALSLSTTSSHVLFGNPVRVVAHAANVDGATLQQRAAGGPWRTLGSLRRGGSTLSLDLRANTDFRVALPGTKGTSVSVDVAPRLRVQALSAKLLGGKVLPRPTAPVQVWRRVRGAWRVVAHPILNAEGEFRTPLPLRPVDYKITVAAGGKLASAEAQLHITRSMLLSFGP